MFCVTAAGQSTVEQRVVDPDGKMAYHHTSNIFPETSIRRLFD